jgi:hypothetical protein
LQVRAFGLVNVRLRKVIDLYAEEGEAELALERVLEDEPGWAADLAVHALELEMQTDGLRLCSSDAEGIELSFLEVPAAPVTEAPRHLQTKNRASRPRRRIGGNG